MALTAPAPELLLPIQDDANSFGGVLGDSLTRTIIRGLGVGLRFPDPSGELQHLADSVGGLSNLEISEPKLAKVVEERQDALSLQVQQERVESHGKSLAQGTVWVASNESIPATSGWQEVHPDLRQRFADNLAGIKASLSPKPFVEETNPEGEALGSIGLEAAGLLEALVTPILKELQALIPDPSTGFIKSIGRVAAKVVRHPRGHPYAEYRTSSAAIKSDKDLPKVSRKTRLLNQIIRELTNDPHGYLAGLIVQKRTQGIEDQAIDAVDESIGTTNEALLRTTTVPKTFRKPRILKLVTEAPEGEKPPVEAEPRPSVAVVNSEASPEEVLETVGTFDLLMPWMPGGKTSTEVKQLTINGKTVYITRGLPPKLEDIAGTSRKKFPLTTEGLSPYDVMAIHLARRAASDVSFYDNSGNITTLPPSKLAQVYKGMPVWASRGGSSNARRLYFTLLKMKNLVDQKHTDAGLSDLERDCVVVLAETTKTTSDQSKVLQVLCDVSDLYQRNRLR